MDTGDVSGGIFDVFDSAYEKFRVKSQILNDKIAPHMYLRWAATGVLLCLYALRVYYLEGWYIVTYALGIYLLNLFIGFLTPRSDPEQGSILPEHADGEFRPFERKLPEWSLWFKMFRSIVIAFFATFFGILDIPVYWPILLVYFIVLMFITLKKEIQKWIKHGYLPFNIGGKPRYQAGV